LDEKAAAGSYGFVIAAYTAMRATGLPSSPVRACTHVRFEIDRQSVHGILHDEILYFSIVVRIVLVNALQRNGFS
jgi:hypothetical protein